MYLRAFSLTRRWLSGPAQVSTGYGNSTVWPGDITGLSTLPPTGIVASWGSDYPDLTGNKAGIYTANIEATLPRADGAARRSSAPGPQAWAAGALSALTTILSW